MARVDSLRSSLDSSLIFRLFYVNCRDAEGNFYFDPVFNETVQIVEFDEGFDTEVFFMWVFMVAGALLVLFLGFTMLGGEFHFRTGCFMAGFVRGIDFLVLLFSCTCNLHYEFIDYFHPTTIKF